MYTVKCKPVEFCSDCQWNETNPVAGQNKSQTAHSNTVNKNPARAIEWWKWNSKLFSAKPASSYFRSSEYKYTCFFVEWDAWGLNFIVTPDNSSLLFVWRDSTFLSSLTPSRPWPFYYWIIRHYVSILVFQIDWQMISAPIWFHSVESWSIAVKSFPDKIFPSQLVLSFIDFFTCRCVGRSHFKSVLEMVTFGTVFFSIVSTRNTEAAHP